MTSSTATLPAASEAPGPNGASALPTSRTQPVLRPWIRIQALNLSRHTLALRDFTREEFGTGAEAPTEGHIRAVKRAP